MWGFCYLLHFLVICLAFNHEKRLNFFQEIVQFFDRRIDYVVTNVPASKLNALTVPKENVDPSGSPAQPSKPVPSTSKRNDDLKQTRQINLSGNRAPSKGVTRGQAMLLAASRNAPTAQTPSPSFTASQALFTKRVS